MEPLYGLTQPTRDAVAKLIEDQGSLVSRPRSGAPARGSTWVKVTGAISGGWYPGVVSIDVNGTFVDLTAPVNVQSADGSPLVNGSRYLCTRTADTSGGVAQFRAPAQAGSFSGAMVYTTTTQACASGGVVNLLFNNEKWDTDNYHDTTSNKDRLTVPWNGYYLIGFTIWADFTAAGYRRITIHSFEDDTFSNLVDGACQCITPALPAGPLAMQPMTMSEIRYSNVNNYFSLAFDQTTGGNVNVGAGAAWGKFWIQLLAKV